MVIVVGRVKDRTTLVAEYISGVDSYTDMDIVEQLQGYGYYVTRPVAREVATDAQLLLDEMGIDT